MRSPVSCPHQVQLRSRLSAVAGSSQIRGGEDESPPRISAILILVLGNQVPASSASMTSATPSPGTAEVIASAAALT